MRHAVAGAISLSRAGEGSYVKDRQERVENMTNVAAGFVESGVGPEDPIDGIRGDAEWRNAWMTAIALAWTKIEYKDALVKDPVAFFKDQCNYTLPAGLTLRVSENTEKDGFGRLTGWDPVSRLWYLQNSEVTMFLPPAPLLEERSVALAAYSATGRTYPFTCG